jgi:hypothetical protein
MAEPTKSAVFVDYESLQRSMNAGQGDMRLADRAVAWVAAIEAGRLVGLEPGPRNLVVKRCYAGANVRGKQRDALSAAGFEVVDSNPGDGGRSSADLHLAMDIIDALSQPNGAHEFILLASGIELAPLLSRLKASKRQTVIFADRATPVGDKALADGIIDAAEFQAFLASDEMPAVEAANAGSASDRAEIEAFARRIHGATNIPLFSPKTFAELFKHLADEIRENGYHFQTTAKNVADQMTATGRSVTRRQVVFIVKGLALKGHVFSNDDSPDDLAEVFREQARYLITNAGITLDQRQDQLLSAWFVSRPQTAAPSPAPRPQQTSANGATAPNGADTEARRAAPQAAEKPAPPRPTPTPPAPPPVAIKPVAPPVKPVDLPKSSAKPTPPPPIRLTPSPSAREEAKAIIAARIAASAKLKPSKTVAPAKPGAKTVPAATGGKSQQPRRGSDVASDALESSILAAIAEAVDVLVDSGAEDEMIVPEPQGKRRANPPRTAEPEPEHDIELEAEPASPEPQPAPADDPEQEGESGDIGDQIQRIIASYNRNRSDD